MNAKDILTRLQLRIYFCDNSYVPFLSSLVQSSKFIESTEIQAPFATDGIDIYYNPELFEIDEKYLFGELIHTLWHIGRLHNLRGKNLNLEDWELACDLVINNDLLNHETQYGKYFDLLEPIYASKFDGLAEEQIYEKIKNQKEDIPQPRTISNLLLLQKDDSNDTGDGENNNSSFTGSNLVSSGSDKAIQQLIKVQAAVQAQRQSQAGTSGIADIVELVDKWGKSKVNWKEELRQFFVDLMPLDDMTWRKRNRRYPDIYMPSRNTDEAKLTHLMYFIDVSGSVSEEDISAFLNECHFVFNELEPEKMTICGFNTRITQRWDFDQNHPFDENIQININGGTSYCCIHDILAEERPTAAVVFTDLYCEPMQPVKSVPVLWVVNEDFNNQHCLLTGKIIHMEE